MKKIIIISLFTISLGLVCGYLLGRKSAVKEIEEEKIYVNYGDDFTKLEVSNSKGTSVSLKANENKRLLVLYLDSMCGACYRQLEVVERMSKIYEDQIDVVVLWGGGMPKEKYEKLGINEAQIYSLEEKLALSDSPAGFIIDSNGKVVFTTTDMKKINKKILSLNGIDRGKIVKKSNQYLKTFFSKTSEKQSMIYFAMEGCKDCNAADKVIDEEVYDRFEIKKLYEEAAYGSEELVDINSLFAQIYNIDWYPSFLILDENEKIIGNTPVDKLKEVMLSE